MQPVNTIAKVRIEHHGTVCVERVIGDTCVVVGPCPGCSCAADIWKIRQRRAGLVQVLVLCRRGNAGRGVGPTKARASNTVDFLLSLKEEDSCPVFKLDDSRVDSAAECGDALPQILCEVSTPDASRHGPLARRWPSPRPGRSRVSSIAPYSARLRRRCAWLSHNPCTSACAWDGARAGAQPAPSRGRWSSCLARCI